MNWTGQQAESLCTTGVIESRDSSRRTREILVQWKSEISDGMRVEWYVPITMQDDQRQRPPVGNSVSGFYDQRSDNDSCRNAF